MNARWGGDVNLGQIVTDDINADKNLAVLAQQRPDGGTNFEITRGQPHLFRPPTRMHIRPGFPRLRHPVDRAHRVAVNQNDPFVTVGHVRQKLLHDQRLAVDAGKHLMQRRQIAVVRVQPEHPRPAIAVKRFQDDIAVPRLERANGVQIAGNRSGGNQIGKPQDKQLFRRIAHPERIIHHKGFRVDQVQQMRCGDISHIKRRVLTQPNHIKISQINLGLIAVTDVIADLAAQSDRKSPRNHPPFNKGQLVGRVKEQRMPPRLRFQGNAKRRIAIDIDRTDRIHLQGYFKGHENLRRLISP